MGRLVDAVLGRIPLQVYERMYPRPPLGINYHMVSDRSLAHVVHVQEYKTEAMFAADLAYLQQRFELLSYADIVARAGTPRRRSSRPAMVLTFDDGYAECYSVVRPILLRFGVPCIFFAISDAIDNRFLPYPNKVSLCIARLRELSPTAQADRVRVVAELAGSPFASVDELVRWMRRLQFGDTPLIDGICAVLEVDADGFLRTEQPFMTRGQLQSLVAEGFTVGAHTRRHPYLYTLHDDQAVESEIVGSCDAVREITGQPSVPFAFPFSADHLNRDVLERIRREHDSVGLLFDMRDLTPDRPFIIKRMKGDTPSHLMAGRSNLPGMMHWTYQRYTRTALARRRQPAAPDGVADPVLPEA